MTCSRRQLMERREAAIEEFVPIMVVDTRATLTPLRKSSRKLIPLGNMEIARGYLSRDTTYGVSAKTKRLLSAITEMASVLHSVASYADVRRACSMPSRLVKTSLNIHTAFRKAVPTLRY